MSDDELIVRYNYDSFVPDKFRPWMRFDESPPLGEATPDFTMTRLDGSSVNLKEVAAAHVYTIVEFGSFT